MGSEMLSSTAQKAERTVEWKKQCYQHRHLNPVYKRPRAITQKGQGCELCVQGGNCPCDGGWNHSSQL